MSRKCSHCGHHGHNSRTCPDRSAPRHPGSGDDDESDTPKVSSMGDLPDQRQSSDSGDEREHAVNATPAPRGDKGPQNMETEGQDGYTSDSIVHQSNTTRERKKGVPWTEDEHRLFLLGLQKLGKGDWRGISRHYVQTRTPTQVASHAQKYFIRQSNLNKRKRRSSLFDIVTEGPVPSAPMNRSGSSASLHYSSDDKAAGPEANAATAVAPMPAAPFPFAYHMPEGSSAGAAGGTAGAQAMAMPHQMYEAMMAAQRRAYNMPGSSPPSTSGFGPGVAPMPFMDPRYAAAFDMAAAAGGAAGMVLPWGMVPGYGMVGAQPGASAAGAGGTAPGSPPPEPEAPSAGAASFANGKLHRPKPSLPKPVPAPSRPAAAETPPSPIEAALAPPPPVKAEPAVPAEEPTSAPTPAAPAPTPTKGAPAETTPTSSGEEKSAVTGAAVDDDGEAAPVSAMSPGSQCAPLQPAPLSTSMQSGERHSAFHTSKLAAAC